jgi:hypothetical protein
MSLQSVIDNLVQSNIFTPVNNGNFRFSCACGSTVSRYSIRRHLDTSRHAKFIRERDVPQPTPQPIPNNVVELVEKECDICYEPRTNFYTCSTCRNDHCMDCHPHIRRCPFCRANFRRQQGRPRVVAPTPNYSPEEREVVNTLSTYQEQFEAVRGRELRLMHFYRMCRYLVQNYQIMNTGSVRSRTYLNLFRNKIIEFTEQGFEAGPLFLQQLV